MNPLWRGQTNAPAYRAWSPRKAPPLRGMALQAEKLACLLQKGRSDPVISSCMSNLPFPKGFRFVQRLPGVRPFDFALPCSHGELRRRNWTVRRGSTCAGNFVAVLFLVVAPAVVLARLAGKRVIVNYRSGEAEIFPTLWMAGRAGVPACQRSLTPSRFLAEAIHGRFGIPRGLSRNIVDRIAFRDRRRMKYAAITSL